MLTAVGDVEDPVYFVVLGYIISANGHSFKACCSVTSLIPNAKEKHTSVAVVPDKVSGNQTYVERMRFDPTHLSPIYLQDISFPSLSPLSL